MGIALKVCVVLLEVLDKNKYIIEYNFAMPFLFKLGMFHIRSAELPAGT